MPTDPVYGPHNPHPLPTMKTELIWEGKYDECGNRRQVDVAAHRKQSKQTAVDIKTTKFMPSLAEVPSKEFEALKERAVKSGVDFIDFWAIDFDWHPEKPFNHHWQDYRTREDRSLKTVSDAGYKSEKSGITCTACVKVIDTFGCDTSMTVEVKA